MVRRERPSRVSASFACYGRCRGARLRWRGQLGAFDQEVRGSATAGAVAGVGGAGVGAEAEATLHALNEIIERDAVSLLLALQRYLAAPPEQGFDPRLAVDMPLLYRRCLAFFAVL